MSDVLTYHGYTARVEFDADDHLFFGRLAGIEDGFGFHSTTLGGLEKAFREAVDDHVQLCARISLVECANT